MPGLSANLFLNRAWPQSGQWARPGLALLLMVGSGFAALGYQIVWTQQCALWLGHESAAVLAVVTAFFGGLALGALSLGLRIERSACPGRWYAVCEALIGLWSLALGGLAAPFSEWMLDLIGLQPEGWWHAGVSFLGTFVLLLPATAAMGATLPAVARAVSRVGLGRLSLALLYAGNTLGAVLGVLACAFWLVPTLGLARTVGVCAACNGLCAVVALVLFGSGRADESPAPSAVPGVWLRLVMTGLLGIGYEVLVVRVLSQVAENTVYTFAMLLAVYLVGSALGASAYQRWRGGQGADRSDRLLWALAGACLLGAGSLWGAEVVKAHALRMLGPGVLSALGAEALLAMLAFLLPTCLMGALFSHLSLQAQAGGLGWARSLGVNTLGAAAAPLVFGVGLVPAIGAKLALLLIVVGYLLLMSPVQWRASRWRGLMGATAIVAVMAPPLVFIDVPEGGRVVSYQEGSMAAVSVVEDAAGVSRLRIDNRQQEGSSATRVADARQALLPLLLHPGPRRALFLGLGTGMTAASAAQDAQLQVDAVELLPEVIAASDHFLQQAFGDHALTRLHRRAADARRFVRTSHERYDVIVSDNFHPARSGSGALYTVEHFQAVRDRLAGGGLFCQWLPLHQLDLATLRSIVQSFLQVFPNGVALLATNSLETPVIGLVGHAQAAAFDLERLHHRRIHVALPQPPAAFGLEDDWAVLGSLVAGPRALRQFAGTAPLNTDDHPVVAYRAPRITYAPDSAPRDRLMALLHEWTLAPEEVLTKPFSPTVGHRLAAYWSARNRFIEAGRGVKPVADVQRMLAQVRDPLLEVLRTSADFRPAYDPLLRMAVALAQVNADEGRALLAELMKLQPARPEARQVIQALASR